MHIGKERYVMEELYIQNASSEEELDQKIETFLDKGYETVGLNRINYGEGSYYNARLQKRLENVPIPLVLSDVSKEQINLMKHALGLSRKLKPYRNYFNCSGNDSLWNDLVDKGFAIKGKGWTEESTYFYVTFEAAKLIYGKQMSKGYFDNL